MSGENNGEHIPLERISRKRSSKEEEGGQQDTKQQRFSVADDPSRPSVSKKGPVFTNIKIPELEKRRGLEYHIICDVDKIGNQWKVCRRYSDIETLYKHIKHNFKGDKDEYPQIPPKYKPSFFSFVHSRAYKASIRARLCTRMEKFLQELMEMALMEDDSSHYDVLVQHFFTKTVFVPDLLISNEHARSLSTEMADVQIVQENDGGKEQLFVPDNKYEAVVTGLESMKDTIKKDRDLLEVTKKDFEEAFRTFDTNDGVTAFSTLAILIAEISPADGSGKNPNPINDFEKSIEEFMKMMTDLKVSYDRKTGRQEKLNDVNKEYKKFMEGVNEEVMLEEAVLEKKRKLTNELKEAYQDYFGSIVETKEKIFGLHDQFHENLHIFLTVDEHSSPPLEQDGLKEEREKEMKEVGKRPRKPERSIQYDDLTMLW
ncbi:hypothetical protein CAEBREN_08682 [Caenorhabditis brenneri]|uniref:PX domain-containing protein n=1 Tax=Caenorhabditis brenneri TaxID=135651 RepID=G0MUE9_CAEBE|nr:hypothetical protein CAEBREN_08682 [Caenorhabditis brenneri]